MPRRPRLVAPDTPLHIIQRGNNRQICFCTDTDFLVYLDLLSRGIVKNNCLLHAYVLMTNHVHLLITPADTRSPGELMKSVGERYVRYFNEQHSRTGTLWDGRYKSCLVQDDAYLLVCHRYIEQNPVRAGMVSEPKLYRWSSHHRNAYNEADTMVTPHAIFDKMGGDEDARARAYRELFFEQTTQRHLRELRDATNANYSFGNTTFSMKMEKALGRQVARVNAKKR